VTGWLATVLLAVQFASAPRENSLLIRGGTVLDGLGSKPRRADVRIEGKRIAAVAKLRARPGEVVIDASGLMIAPGFIDAHSHADVGVSDRPMLESQIRQGITTAIVGQDGGGSSPISELFARLESARPALNFAAFAGHGRIRQRVLGEGYKRHATKSEIERMRSLLEADMRGGALGLSTGLEYDPGFYSTAGEIVALAKVAAKHGGIYISHMRDEGNNAEKSFEELIRIAEEARIPAQVSHIKLATASVWGKAQHILAKIESARKRGLDVTADVYPYLYWQSTITVLTLDRNWSDRRVWERALEDVGGPSRVLLSEYSPDRAWVGKTLAEIASDTGKDPVSVIQEIVRKTHGPDGAGRESIVCTSMEERDLHKWMRWPHAMFCSDGRDGGTHPRGAGAFPRVLGKYVRQEKVLSLAEAVRKMTSLPARRFGLTGRGVLRPGSIADVVVFDPAIIADTATPQNPTSYSVGVKHVFVNGVPVLREGAMTGERPGLILKPSDRVILQRRLNQMAVPRPAADRL